MLLHIYKYLLYLPYLVSLTNNSGALYYLVDTQ